MRCSLLRCSAVGKFFKKIVEYAQFLSKMNMNGVNTNADREPCKRAHEDNAEEPNKKVCSEASRIDAKKKFKKHKYAMLLGYNGRNYHGMQINNEFDTVESKLFKAFAKVGIMKECEVTEPYAIRFQRAARTDRTVSAAGQVVSFLMSDGTCKPEDINEHLPPDIRIFSFKRVTKGFDSKGNCGGRTYSYILPTQVFSKEPLEKFSEIDYRITPDLISKIDEVLNLFIGTHNFHNFSSKFNFGDPRAKRFIMEFRCGESFVQNKEFIILSVTGQSFILHQIRKMVGATIGIIRGMATPNIIPKAFLSEKINIPLAPGDGLFLERPHFEQYNRRYGNDGFHETLTWEEVEADMKKFRQEKIINAIIEQELKNNVLINWVTTRLTVPDKFFVPHWTEDVKLADTAEEVDDEECEVAENLKN